MNLYDLIVFVHVAAAFSLLSGSVVGSPATRAALRRAQTTQEVRTCLGISRPLLVLEPVSAIVVLASGIHLTRVAGFWSLGWVQAAAAFWLANAVVAGAMVKPILGRIAAEARVAADGPVGQPLDELRRSQRWSVGGDLLAANDAAMLYVMVMKPELAGALLVVAVANLIVLAARRVGHVHRSARVKVSRAASL